MRGHTLLWHEQLPAWITQGTWTRATLEPVLKQYVQTVVAHYRGKVDSWDVVNEPLADDGTLRQNLWYRVIGPDYISLALQWARQADPNVKLFINDYGAERPSAKRDGLLRLVNDLRSRGVPLDGVGFQAHFTTAWYATRAELTNTLQQFASARATRGDHRARRRDSERDRPGRAREAGRDLRRRRQRLPRRARVRPRHDVGDHRRLDLARPGQAAAAVRRELRREAGVHRPRGGPPRATLTRRA